MIKPRPRLDPTDWKKPSTGGGPCDENYPSDDPEVWEKAI